VSSVSTYIFSLIKNKDIDINLLPSYVFSGGSVKRKPVCQSSNAHISMKTGDPIPLLINEVPGSKKETKRSTALLQHLCHDRLVLSFI